jgi:hypothetical protein
MTQQQPLDWEPAPDLSPARSVRWQPRGMAWWYWALIDEMLANPELNKTEIAKKLRVTPQCIYLVTNSDTFKLHYEARRREFAAQLDGVIRTRLEKVAGTSLDLISKVLEAKQTTVPLETLSEVADKALERLGYGPKASPAVSVTVDNSTQTVVAPVSLQVIEEARATLREVERSRMLQSRRGEVEMTLPAAEESEQRVEPSDGSSEVGP